MLKDLYLFLLIIFSFGSTVINCLFLDHTYEKNHWRALITKTLASACFVLVGLFATLYKGTSTYQTVVFIGLCIGLVGDVLLALRHIFSKYGLVFFIAGAVTFSVEHFLIIGYFLLNSALNLYIALPLFAVILGGAVAIFLTKKLGGGILKIGIYSYITVISFMAACALTAIIAEFSLKTALFALGSACFWLSDVILCLNNFAEKKSFSQVTVLHFLYFIAQTLIAISIIG